tara:strand:+ start:875 stop:988 length:114 start_codon:yes stop_codon:yes gene_type:complete
MSIWKKLGVGFVLFQLTKGLLWILLLYLGLDLFGIFK